MEVSMHASIELWQAVVGVVVLAPVVNFAWFWFLSSLKRVPATWKEYWGKFGRTISA
jgi:hypothetical protein